VIKKEWVNTYDKETSEKAQEDTIQKWRLVVALLCIFFDMFIMHTLAMLYQHYLLLILYP